MKDLRPFLGSVLTATQDSDSEENEQLVNLRSTPLEETDHSLDTESVENDTNVEDDTPTVSSQTTNVVYPASTPDDSSSEDEARVAPPPRRSTRQKRPARNCMFCDHEISEKCGEQPCRSKQAREACI